LAFENLRRAGGDNVPLEWRQDDILDGHGERLIAEPRWDLKERPDMMAGMETQPLLATPEEDQSLRRVIDNWDALNPTQRGICIMLARGTQRPAEIADCLNVSLDAIHAERRGIHVVLYDRSRDQLWIK
jgi:DNA-binding CsgD family transcriptional regulator